MPERQKRTVGGPRYPKLHVTLPGGDGNAFAILAGCNRPCAALAWRKLRPPSTCERRPLATTATCCRRRCGG
jgi:hypothetical protein